MYKPSTINNADVSFSEKKKEKCGANAILSW